MILNAKAVPSTRADRNSEPASAFSGVIHLGNALITGASAGALLGGSLGGTTWAVVGAATLAFVNGTLSVASERKAANMTREQRAA